MPVASLLTDTWRRMAPSAMSRPPPTRARLLQEKGKRTPVVIRFSTVIGGRDSSEAARDPRGFAVKFKTEDGNWDLVGNDLMIFFIRDAIKFPRRDPCPQAGPHHLPPGAEAHLRLHEPDARVHAHADVALLTARHPQGLPPHGRCCGQHLQVGQRSGRGGPGQVSLEDQTGHRVAHGGTGSRDPGDRSRPRLQGPLRGHRARRLPRVGVLPSDHVGRGAS